MAKHVLPSPSWASAVTPASIRNNNPGAMEPGPSSKKFGATSYETLRWTYNGRPATNRIATFPTPVHGAAAMFDLLYRRYAGSTVEAAITKWCGGYYASDYSRSLEQRCGVGPKTTLTKERVRDAETAILLAKGMARVEAGREFPLTDEQWRQAHDMAFAGATAPEPTVDNDVPFPKPEARQRAVVTEVAKTGAIGGGLATGGAVLANGGLILDGAKTAVAKGHEVKTVIKDAKALVPNVPVGFSVPLAVSGAAFLVALVVFHVVPKIFKR